MNNTAQYGNNGYIDFNDAANYVIQWLEESRFARDAYQRELFRVTLAMEGKPWKNLYQEELDSNIGHISDPNKREQMKKACLCVPEGQSLELYRAMKKRANQVAAGVDYYEYQIHDPFMLIDNGLSDRLAAKCAQDYAEGHLGEKSAMFSRDLTRAGMAAVLVKYHKDTDTNEILRVNPKNCWFDTMYSATGKERFRGYSTMISYSTLLKMIEADGDEVNTNITANLESVFDSEGKFKKKASYSNGQIKTLNDLSIYVHDLNHLACSPELQGPLFNYGEYDHDLRTCYNLNWYRSFATDPEARTKNGYNGDDVELTVIYDMGRKIEFKVINRRYVISANSKCFRRDIDFNIYNSVTQKATTKTREYTAQCPLIFRFEDDETTDKLPYPSSPVFKLLDVHDELCSWIARRKHVSKILAVLRIETNAADAESLRGLLNVMGIVLDDIQGDIGTINYTYDYTPIDSEIERLTKDIVTTLSAYDEFDAMQMMGDRASASESGLASSAVAQGLATHQNAIMALYEDIARVSIGNRVVYSDKGIFQVNNNGQYDTLTIQDLAYSATITVKSKLAKKVEERTLSANAITLLGTLKQNITNAGVGYFIEQAMMGNVPRRVAQTFVKPVQTDPAVVQANMQQAQNMAMMLQQNQQMYNANPLSYEANDAMQTLSPDEIDQVITGLDADNAQPAVEEEAVEEETTPEGLDMTMQEGAMAAGVEGQTPEFGSQLANPNSMI